MRFLNIVTLLISFIFYLSSCNQNVEKEDSKIPKTIIQTNSWSWEIKIEEKKRK